MSSNLIDTDSEDEMPSGWEERTTLDSRVYYVNHETKSTQWTHPVTGRQKRVIGDLPYGWERTCTDDGVVLYVDHENEKTTFTDPRLAFAVEETNEANEIRQKFDGSSTAFQILHGRDLTGKVIMVTGANCGIGFETAKSLAFHGAHIVMACRNLIKANEAILKIKELKVSYSEAVSHIVTLDQLKTRLERDTIGFNVREVLGTEHAKLMFDAFEDNLTIDALYLDLSSLRQVQEFAHEFKLKYRRLDVLIMNAGVCGHAYTQTVDGYEMTFQVNHLGHFYLFQLLETLLIESAPSRVVVVSSESHRSSTLDAATLSMEKLSPVCPSAYQFLNAYGNSKLCNIIFSRFVDCRLKDKGVRSYSLHPGNLIPTELSRTWWVLRLLFTIVRPFTKSLQQGSATTVYCAIDPELENAGGAYFNNCFVCSPSNLADDPVMANKLWKLSEIMVEEALKKSLD